MSDVKHRIFVGHSEPVTIDGILIIPEIPLFTFDSTVITFDSRNSRFDEAN